MKTSPYYKISKIITKIKDHSIKSYQLDKIKLDPQHISPYRKNDQQDTMLLNFANEYCFWFNGIKNRNSIEILQTKVNKFVDDKISKELDIIFDEKEQNSDDRETFLNCMIKAINVTNVSRAFDSKVIYEYPMKLITYDELEQSERSPKMINFHNKLIKIVYTKKRSKKYQDLKKEVGEFTELLDIVYS